MKLEFKLADKGNLVVKLINQSGKTVFEDKVKKFSGDYSNEIDLSKIDDETLYIMIAQGDKSKIEKFMKK